MPGQSKSARQRAKRKMRRLQEGSSFANLVGVQDLNNPKQPQKQQQLVPVPVQKTRKLPLPSSKPGRNVSMRRFAPNVSLLPSNVASLMKSSPTDLKLKAVMEKLLLCEMKGDHKPIIPRGMSVGPQAFFEAYHNAQMVIDLVTVIASTTRSEVPTIQEKNGPVKLWSEGVFSGVQVFDGSVYAIIPCVPNGNRVGNDAWVALMDVMPVDYMVGDSPARDPTFFQCNLVSNLTSKGLPTGLDVRPPCAQCDAEKSHQYFWIDACESAAANVSLSMTANAYIHGGGELHLSLYLKRFVSKDSEDITVGNKTVAYDDTTPPTINFNAAITGVPVSGFYRLELRIAALNSSQQSYIKETSSVVVIEEFTTLSTGFLVDHAHTLSGSIGDSYWLSGAGLMLSCRFPKLTTEGSITAASIDQFYGVFYEATPDVQAAIAESPSNRQFNDGDGGQLSQGLWSYGAPVKFPNDLRSVTMDVTTLAANSPAVAYIMPGNTKPGMKLFCVSLSTDDTEVIVKLSGKHVISYTPFSQVVPSESPMMLSLDEWGLITELVYSAPPFTTNDFHEGLAKVIEGFITFAEFCAKWGPRLLAAIELAGYAAAAMA